jgi:hypothetical protein
MKKLGKFQSQYGRKLEDLFFHQQDKVLVEQFHRMQEMKESKECLAKVSGITNDAILQRLVELDVRPEIVASLAIIPLGEVAWADGSVDEKEKAAVLKAASKSYFAEGSIDYSLLTQWLEHRPSRNLLDAWAHYIEGLCEMLSASEKTSLRDELIGHARQVAQAAGGFLGLGKISDAEQGILSFMESAFD